MARTVIFKSKEDLLNSLLLTKLGLLNTQIKFKGNVLERLTQINSILLQIEEFNTIGVKIDKRISSEYLKLRNHYKAIIMENL